ncbi:hypothetical protein B484DRAFT_444536 [Ochromonadaceae sp. CCMP2298]|nr:hypothetical protein B484DRAFT_444536 [Ochromonadaceae sp. CCMP2298]
MSSRQREESSHCSRCGCARCSCLDHLDCADAWSSVPVRMRTALMGAFASSEVIRAFLRDVEVLLLCHARAPPAQTQIEEQVQAHTEAQTGGANARTASASPSTSQPTPPLPPLALGAESLSQATIAQLLHLPCYDPSGNLLLPLLESPFRRLLVHGAAQFYGLQSKSVQGANGTPNSGSKHKFCVVLRPPASRRYSLPAATTRSLSLSRFLQAQLDLASKRSAGAYGSVSESAACTVTNTSESNSRGARLRNVASSSLCLDIGVLMAENKGI